ncbi:MAG: flavin reductase family protein [Syntrophomonadaceae bacterium]|nr:flavin reductase family protein [Syntrophomonadaceae bacterium]MDD3890562.1 flavin reductase family protein [Syntrophomonadaceae bacterium]MDD4550320.1 flavin reductase family protein [Syntrophomonadaceae bacterium]
MYTNLEYNEYAREMLTQLPRGAFLSVKAGAQINTMTIGWGSIGYIWKKPLLIVAVRTSRYTYELMEKATDFSVSLPLDADLKTALGEAGKKSGRDIDKFQHIHLTAQEGQKIESPVIGECKLIYECKIVYKQQLDPEMLGEEIKEKFYADHDYHTLYFGEIVSSYING